MNADNLKEVEETKEESEKELYLKRYKSKNGFMKVNNIRGIYEIKHLFTLLKPYTAFICGGYVRYCASKNINPFLPSDIDIYVGNIKDFQELKMFFIDKEGLKIKHENEISLTFERPSEGKYAYHLPLQIIKPMSIARIVTEYDGTNIENVLSSFDFTVIRGALLNQDESIVDVDFDHDETNKILRIKNIHCPISSTLRCMKYVKKGYYLSPIQVACLMCNWEDRDEEYRNDIINMIKKLEDNRITQEEIDHLEALMMID